MRPAPTDATPSRQPGTVNGPPRDLPIVRLADVARSIVSGDLLLRRGGRSPVDRAIGQEGRSRYVHAGMAAWWNSELMCLHTSAVGGCRAEALANLVEAAPGEWDVWPAIVAPTGARLAAVEYMRRLTGRAYGWRAVLRVALSRAPGLRWLWPIVTDDSANGTYPPFCSQAVAAAWRAAGADPVPNLPDNRTEPGDLARSLMFRPFCTLVP